MEEGFKIYGSPSPISYGQALTMNNQSNPQTQLLVTTPGLRVSARTVTVSPAPRLSDAVKAQLGLL